MKGDGDFSIGSAVWPGIGKLAEEAGEVLQVIGKLIGSRGDPQHWDGTDLRERLEEEMGDLLAAIEFVTEKNGLNEVSIAERASEKLALFNKWHDDPKNRPADDNVDLLEELIAEARASADSECSVGTDVVNALCDAAEALVPRR